MRSLLATLVLLIGCSFVLAQDSQPAIDWNRAQELHRRATRGEKLNADDQAYYDRAKAARARQGGAGNNPQPPTPRESTGLVPLTSKSDAAHKGQTFGLYGQNRNDPPAEHLKRAMAAAESIKPLDAAGKPDPTGKIVLMSIGMSNTTQEFSRFVQLADQDAAKNPALIIVDAAQGGQDADAWCNPQKRDRPWGETTKRLQARRATDAQVQILWIKQALIGPSRLGEFPKHAQVLRDNIISIIGLAKERFPNLKLVYMSSRTYAGWATTALNPEPYSYESAYSVRWVIDGQLNGDNAAIAYDKCPVLLWGPYLWTDGTKGRDLDTLVWEKADTSNDGTHPSDSGRKKVADQLLTFFKTSPTTKAWFLK